MKTRFHKEPTNIEKLQKSDMTNKVIITPPQAYNHLLFEKYGQDQFSVTAFNPFGHKAYMIVKNIALIPLSFLTYKLLTPKRKIIKAASVHPEGREGPATTFKPKKGIL